MARVGRRHEGQEWCLLLCGSLSENIQLQVPQLVGGQGAGKGTLVLVPVDSVVYIFRVLEVMSHHYEMRSLALCVIMK